MLKELGVKPTKQLAQDLVDTALDETTARNIQERGEESGQVEVSGRKISGRFAKIEAVEMQDPTHEQLK
jgi:hypothetical protein